MNRAAGSHGSDSAEVLARLRELRELDAPTHGGRVLSYVYDAGLPELDALAGRAAELARPLNGLDPTTFPSVAAMERDLISFTRRALNGHRRRLGGPVVGSVTSGGTESCLLAVKAARDLWRRRHPDSRTVPRLVAPVTAHAAFQKAARMFDLEWCPVPCDTDGSVRATELIGHLDDDVALVVVSAPAYPSGAMDPIGSVSDAASARGIPCHVDACFGGLALPWWPGAPVWDFRLPGVTSISADLHKFGYAPKGVSVLLHRGRAPHRAQFFATTGWPGYPVVNPTLLGSRSISPIAAAWAITRRLGAEGYRELTASCERATHRLVRAVDGIPGLAVQGRPMGPVLSLVADESVPSVRRVDPHHLTDALTRLGFMIQHQPGHTQSNGVRLPHSAHLTITPVTEQTAREFIVALQSAADAVRGRRPASPVAALAAMRMLGYGVDGRVPGPSAAWAILRSVGVSKRAKPGDQAQLMALD
ncbi:pyridoxal phosphate-dependent decarboxylase family protein, partial [Leucobacter soli]|uniref:pyridoxal phosphate-dependent decarboxylase family protein n=1 Tax=Leucobacter soli TaxID=2812850 RepID=UPI0036228841